ncbi:hypothetical protein [Rhodanobacter glycinis]|uniref:hypothetical protein n=1 Tax=Rhodanobacter glycinis TaxID=582702 RepID=UPI0013755D5F|nr:hypothetical protein [Rhodanobacter glycinis]
MSRRTPGDTRRHRTDVHQLGNQGQCIVAVPSWRLVIARFGATIDPPDLDFRA